MPDDVWFSRGVEMRVVDAAGRVTQSPWLDLIEPLDVDSVEERRYVLVEAGDTWASIGKFALGQATNWKVVAEMSGVVDPFTELVTGDTLTTPTLQSFFFDVVSS
jgi:hypothetical protein